MPQLNALPLQSKVPSDFRFPKVRAGAARLWQGGGGPPWLEWNGAAYLLGSTVTADQFPALFVRDFDGDGQNELALQWMNAGFARYEVYEWNQSKVPSDFRFPKAR